MQHLAKRPWITIGIAAAGASTFIAPPVTVTPHSPRTAGIQLTAAESDIVIDFVRHGQNTGNVQETIDTQLPGGPLTTLGQQQADDVAHALFKEFGGPNGVAGIFDSQFLRTQETAAPFSTLENMTPQTLPGLNEVNAGIYTNLPEFSGIVNGRPEFTPGLLGYLGAALSWALGLDLTPIPGSTDINGVAFDERFSDAVQTMYDYATSSGVVSANDMRTDVAFSHAEAISTWVMMNVKNPDPFLQFTDPLANAGQVVVEGNPENGWTLVSWNGTPVPAATLPTELFVDFRNLVEAPQFAGWNIFEALLTGDSTTITSAIQTGLEQVGSAFAGFPGAVIDDILAST